MFRSRIGYGMLAASLSLWWLGCGGGTGDSDDEESSDLEDSESTVIVEKTAPDSSPPAEASARGPEGCGDDPCLDAFCEVIPDCQQDEDAPDASEGEDPADASAPPTRPKEPCEVDRNYDIPTKIPPVEYDTPTWGALRASYPRHTNMYYRVRLRLPSAWDTPVAYSWGITDPLGMLMRGDRDGRIMAFVLSYDSRPSGVTEAMNQLTKRRLDIGNVRVTGHARPTISGRESYVFEYTGILPDTCESVHGITLIYPRKRNMVVVLSALVKTTGLSETQKDEKKNIARAVISSVEDFTPQFVPK